MNETMVTVVGNVATKPDFRDNGRCPAVRFRLASTVRRYDRERNLWADGATSFYTVWAWRALAHNLTASVSIGEPLVVHGRLRVQDSEREGQRWTVATIDAVAVGHDLTRGTSAWVRAASPRAEFGEARPDPVPTG
ncbi:MULTISPECIES: single-stranded DNA-binding protein [unclassified Streptomyces]|uniref:single-stranded DNA-binding protein n=1 Tax=unclassified Streptomyces TaxID=2593676 RepID=UPI0022B6DB61|nr:MULTISPECIES: single-stranded DNA-binding protein [unclassified Streptomyces]MCZ7414267.1 single-stranded DNA-binding protein [Streptomyces sp. WMMC897]MCZ7431285.1 single-stranded DNA-binding protein [Streptomyces sp. WMMC1477]